MKKKPRRPHKSAGKVYIAAGAVLRKGQCHKDRDGGRKGGDSAVPGGGRSRNLKPAKKKSGKATRTELGGRKKQRPKREKKREKEQSRLVPSSDAAKMGIGRGEGTGKCVAK